MKLFDFSLLLVFSIWGQTLSAQATAKYYRIYDTETVRLANEGMIKNGKYQPNLYFNGHLSKELTKTPAALESYNKSRSLHNTAATFFTLSFISLTAGSFAFESDNRTVSRQGSTAAMVGLTGLFLSDFIYSRSAVKQSRAVWLHNRSQILQNIHALDSTKNYTFIENNYDQKTIYLTGNRFVQNGKSQQLGFLSHNLGEVLKKDNAAFRSYKQFKNRRLWGSILAVAGTSVMFLNKDRSEGIKPAWSGLVLLGGYTISHTGLYISNSAHKKLQEGIWHYNRTAIFGVN